MGIIEEKKNKKLSRKYSSHTVNILKYKVGTLESGKEIKKAKKATKRFHKFIKKTTKK